MKNALETVFPSTLAGVDLGFLTYFLVLAGVILPGFFFDQFRQASIIMLVVVSTGFLFARYLRHRDIFSPEIATLGALLFFYLGDPSYAIESTRYYQIVTIGLLGMCLGLMMLSDGPRVHYVRRYIIPPGSIHLTSVAWLVGAIGFCGIVLQAGIPILQDNVQEYRIEMQRHIRYFGFLQLCYKSHLLSIYLSAVIIFSGEATKAERVMVTFLGITSFVMLACFGNRGLVIFPLFSVLVIVHYLFRRMSLRSVVAMFVALVLIIGVSGFLRSAGSFEYATTDKLLDRTLLELSVPSFNLDQVVRIYPEKHEHMLGEAIVRPFVTLLPGKQLLIDWEVKQLSGLDFRGGGLPPTMFGLFYIDFGLLGVFALSFLVGAVVSFLKFLLDSGFSIFHVCMYAIGLEMVVSGFRNVLSPDLLALYIFGVLIFFRHGFIFLKPRRTEFYFQKS